jgi:hypothetical protein
VLGNQVKGERREKRHACWVESNPSISLSTVIPTKVSYQDEVAPFIGNLTTEHMQSNLRAFTNFRTRYYKSSYGAKSCRWLIQQVKDVIDNSDADHVTVNEFPHSVIKNDIILSSSFLTVLSLLYVVGSILHCR